MKKKGKRESIIKVEDQQRPGIFQQQPWKQETMYSAFRYLKEDSFQRTILYVT